MSLKTTLLTFTFSILTITICSDGFAQYNRPGRSIFRALGIGQGVGYHKCNPGPNTDYYNPYTEHNSGLVSNPWTNANENSWTPSTIQPQNNGSLDKSNEAPGPRNGIQQPDSDTTNKTSKFERIKSVYQWPTYDSPKVQNAIRTSFPSPPRDSVFAPLLNHQYKQSTRIDKNQ